MLPKETPEATVSLYLEVISAKHLDKVRAKTYAPTKIHEYERFSQDEPLCALKKYFFKDVYGHDHVKDAIILQQFSGGTSSKTKRDNIHLLLAGDPAAGKSKMLKNVYQKVSGVYTTGIGTSAVGLTATVYREADGRWSIDGGALVLANGRTVFVDELDKMNLNQTSGLLEAMEQQTVSISKASISMVLPTKFNLLAAANPRFSNVFKDDEPPYLQLKLPAPLLSRFDLIFVLRNTQKDSFSDRQLLTNIMNEEESNDVLGVDLNEYLGYARSFNPTLLPEIKEHLVNIFTENKEKAAKREIPLSVRQLEGLIRLVKARARMYLRSTVTLADVEFCKNLFEKSVAELCGYTKDGSLRVIDTSLLLSCGLSQKDQKVADAIVLVLKEQKQPTSEHGLLLKVLELAPTATKKDFLKAVNILIQEGLIYKPDGLKYRLSS